MKTYQSGSVAALSITLPNGRNKFIRFDSQSNGKSIYITTDRDIMAGIEGCARFKEGGIKIIADTEPKEQPKKVVTPTAPAAPKAELRKADEFKEVRVASWEDAKNYLVDELGINGKKIRTQSQIMAAAQANNIHFIF